MKKSVLLGTGILATALLMGCGGSSSGGSSVSEYDLSAYEGREVSTDTLAGTWVAVGTGRNEYIDSETQIDEYAVKEYFVITGSGSTFSKARCDSASTRTLTLSEGVVTGGDFTGTVTENKLIVGKEVSNFGSGNDYSGKENLALTMVKISDLVEPVVTVDVATTAGNIEGTLSCFQQSNGNIAVNGSRVATFKDFNAYPFKVRYSVSSHHESTSLTSQDPSVYLDTDLNNTVSFELITDSSLSETLAISAYNNAVSLSGTVIVSLPAQ